MFSGAALGVALVLAVIGLWRSALGIVFLFRRVL